MDIQNANRPCVMGVTHTVAAGHYMSAQAGLQMLEAGGIQGKLVFTVP